MKVTILDDYHDTLRTLPCFAKLEGHEVSIWNDHVQDTDVLAERLRDTEALVLIRERTKIRAPLIERMSWALYDFSNTIFSMNVATLYFTVWLVGDLGVSNTMEATASAVDEVVLGLPAERADLVVRDRVAAIVTQPILDRRDEAIVPGAAVIAGAMLGKRQLRRVANVAPLALSRDYELGWADSH
jgi:hypothetical protein